MKLVFDTNTIISRLLIPNSLPSKALDLGFNRGQILVSDAVLNELADVLSRKKFDKYISIEDRQAFLRLFIHTTKRIEIVHSVELCRDPKDDKFLDLAMNGEADYMVSGDQDLLEMNEIGKTKIVTPSAFIRIK